VAGMPKPKTLRVMRLSHCTPAKTPLAMQAGGIPPVLESSVTVAWTFVWPVQSKASLQMFCAEAPLPRVTRPPKLESKLKVVSFGVRIPVRTI
jgi:hypothetical protein